MNKLVVNLKTGEQTIVPLSKEEIQARLTEQSAYEAEAAAREIEEAKRAEYPPISDLVVALWDAIAANPEIEKTPEFDALEATRQAVKDKYLG